MSASASPPPSSPPRSGILVTGTEVLTGIISGYEGSKPRQVLITEADVPRILLHFAEAEGGSPPPPPRIAPEPAPVRVPDDGD